jgi:diguanylate cyclase (GGDEF)-like protein/PAS domain S-box-containing protein
METLTRELLDTEAAPGTPRRIALLVLAEAALLAWLALRGAGSPQLEHSQFLALHTVLEVFAVVVAAMIFIFGWHNFDNKSPRGLAILVPPFLAIALLELGHLVCAPGMPGLGQGPSAAAAAAFWLVAGLACALSLLAVALTPAQSRAWPKARLPGLAAGLALAACGYWLALDWQALLPPALVDDTGPGIPRTWTAWGLALLLAQATIIMTGRARATNAASSWHVVAGMATETASAAAFALAAHGDVFDVLAHVFKLAGFLFLHRAIYVAAVREPYLRLQRSERRLAESENKFRGLMEAAPDAIVLSDAAGRIAMINACAESLFGLARDAAAGLPVKELVPVAAPGEPDATGEVTCRRVAGGTFPAEVRRAQLAAGGGRHDIAIVRDVSERRRLEKELVRRLTHDALTGLPNRGRILETMGDAIALARAAGQMLAVMVLDLDRFKKVNDNYGYADGDAVLRECANRIEQALGEGDTLARQGGNEFIVVRKNLAGRHEAVVLAEALMARMREPFATRAGQVFLSASIGIALMPEDEVHAPELLHKAQVAMGAARQAGPGRYRFHTWEMEQAIRERVSLESLLRHALERDELAVQYQPRVSMASGDMVGVEALVRWRHPRLGLVAPSRFIPIAEETGMIEQIDMWVLREACACAAGWEREGLPPVRVSVNLSARQFQQDGLARRVRAVLDETGLAPYRLELEITESTVMHDIRAAQAVLHSLKQTGVAVSIDDFGTGYSSLSYLKRFPIDVLKIDRSFVTDVMADPNDAAIVRALIGLAHGLDLEAVAEGVETLEQVAFLKANGCDEIQGYYYSPPVWPEQLARMLGGATPECRVDGVV